MHRLTPILSIALAAAAFITACADYSSSLSLADSPVPAHLSCQVDAARTTLSCQFQVNCNCYIGLGSSSSGVMSGTNAYVGTPGSVNWYKLTGYALPSASSAGASSAASMSRNSSGWTVLSVSQPYTTTSSDSYYVTSSNGDTNFAFAIGYSTNLVQHQYSVVIQLNVLTGQASAVVTQAASWKIAHGALMLSAWAVLLPVGSLFPRFLRSLLKQFGFKGFSSHRNFQIFGVLVGLVGFILAVASVGTTHFHAIHTTLGLIVTVLSLLQVTGGFIPKLKFGHKYLGMFVMALAVITVAFGLGELNGTSSKQGFTIAAVILYLLSSVLALFSFRDFVQKQQKVKVDPESEPIRTEMKKVEPAGNQDFETATSP